MEVLAVEVLVVEVLVVELLVVEITGQPVLVETRQNKANNESGQSN